MTFQNFRNFDLQKHRLAIYCFQLIVFEWSDYSKWEPCKDEGKYQNSFLKIQSGIIF